MIVTAMLAWFDEPIELLGECIESLSCCADRLIAVDGGYELVEDAAASSPPNQVRAIKAVAKRTGLECEVWVPNRVWIGQVEKRNWMAQKACLGSDWVMPMDADWFLRGDRDQIRRQLDTTTAEALSVPLFTPAPNDPGLVKKLAPHEWHSDLANRVYQASVFFRVLPGFRVESNHWWYTAIKDGKRISLYGANHIYPSCATQQIAAHLTIEHRCFARKQKQLDRNRIFIRRREAQVQDKGYED